MTLANQHQPASPHTGDYTDQTTTHRYPQSPDGGSLNVMRSMTSKKSVFRMARTVFVGSVTGALNQLNAFFDWMSQRVFNARLEDNGLSLARSTRKKSMPKTRFASPEEDVRHLLMNAGTLDDVWQFFVERLSNGPSLDVMCLSVLDDSGDFIRVKNVYPNVATHDHTAENSDSSEMFISMNDAHNHLVQAYQRKDTTFSPRISALGNELLGVVLNASEGVRRHLTPDENGKINDQSFNMFSVPFMAGGKTIALLTLGFAEMDAFSQAKLSFVYTLRDHIAQLVWNLVLIDRMAHQAHVDRLTGLLTHSSFQSVLESEIKRSQLNLSPMTVMLLDINNLDAINKDKGHEAGDAAICHLASLVRRHIRGLDTVARHGGDDVVVLLPEVDAEGARLIADNFLYSVQDRLPKELQGLTISVGYATFPDDTRKAVDVMSLSEQALQLAKYRARKSEESVCIGSSELHELNEKTVLEVFASHVAKKYNSLEGHSVYKDLLKQLENQGNSVNGVMGSTADELMLETITSLTGALDAKDRYTRGHSQAVANYAVALAHALKLSPEDVESTRLAAFLHDIGKIGIPEHILCKQGPLTDEELEVMKQHPVIGADQILAPVSSLRPVIPAVKYHHENWDGSGYPEGLKGEDIPLGARIIAIVDAFHAVTSDRAYRKALPVVEAKKILEQSAGTKFDPNLTEVFFSMLTIATPKTKEVVGRCPIKNNKVDVKEAQISQLQVFPVEDVAENSTGADDASNLANGKPVADVVAISTMNGVSEQTMTEVLAELPADASSSPNKTDATLEEAASNVVSLWSL